MAREVVQVFTFGVVEGERSSDGIEHAVGRSREVPTFEAGVVVDADASKSCDLLPAQPRDAASRAEGLDARLLGADPGTPGGDEVPDLCAVAHTPTVGAHVAGKEGLP